MTLNIRPILSALLRNRTGAVLVATQIALALAILVNAVYVVKQRVDSIDRPTGIDDRNMFAIETAGFTSHYDPASAVREDMAYLRGLDGVISASAFNAVPLSGSGSAEPWYMSAERKSSEQVFGMFYETDEQGLRTLGAHLVAGRDFRPEESVMLPERGDFRLVRVKQQKIPARVRRQRHRRRGVQFRPGLIK